MYKYKFLFFGALILVALVLSGCVGPDTCATCGPLPPFAGTTNEDVLKYLQTVTTQYNICNGLS